MLREGDAIEFDIVKGLTGPQANRESFAGVDLDAVPPVQVWLSIDWKVGFLRIEYAF